jgi:hypothetical protein
MSPIARADDVGEDVGPTDEQRRGGQLPRVGAGRLPLQERPPRGHSGDGPLHGRDGAPPSHPPSLSRFRIALIFCCCMLLKNRCFVIYLLSFVVQGDEFFIHVQRHKETKCAYAVALVSSVAATQWRCGFGHSFSRMGYHVRIQMMVPSEFQIPLILSLMMRC